MTPATQPRVDLALDARPRRLCLPRFGINRLVVPLSRASNPHGSYAPTMTMIFSPGRLQ